MTSFFIFYIIMFLQLNLKFLFEPSLIKINSEEQQRLLEIYIYTVKV